MDKPQLCRWTRNKILEFEWSPFETLDKLVISSNLRDHFTQRLSAFLIEKSHLHSLKLPWRYGMFLFGPSGSGKTAASRGLAQHLKWSHYTIPEHEILDSHLFEKSLHDAISKNQRVIVLDNIDQMLSRMEPEVFFTLLDHAMERAEGSLWIATTRHAENVPKTQLIRPGRFDESIRFEQPSKDLRIQMLIQVFDWERISEEGSSLSEWVEMTQGLTFSHFEEMRQIVARARARELDPHATLAEIKSFVEDQVIAGDRLGGISDQTEILMDRVQQVDPRVLTAALNMTDVFKVLIEKTIGDAAERSKLMKDEEP
jgi:SpoVK/Ycf46/Vps4 family AAA+-type ATPase